VAVRKHRHSARVPVDVLRAAVNVLVAVLLLAGMLAARERANAAALPPAFNLQAQAACETEMLRDTGAHEVFSGKGYEVLVAVARAYGRATPHMYVFPGSFG
jgi:hypothetical protein